MPACLRRPAVVRIGVPSLGPRLEAIAGFVLPRRPMADIGTDHAYLPVALIRRGVVPRAIASDLRRGPLEAARRTVESEGCADRIELRCADGVLGLRPGEAETLVIAGMGGRSIVDILIAGSTQGVRRLVLQPNTGAATVRRHLDHAGWRIVAEVIVEDAGRFYPIVAAEAGSPSLRMDEVDFVIGPLLRHRPDHTTRAWAAQELSRTERALEGLSRAQLPHEARRSGLEALAALLIAYLSPAG